MMLCVLMCFVIVMVMMLIGFVLVISMFLLMRLNDNVVCVVLLNGLKIDVRLLEIFGGILNVLNVGIVRYLVNVFLWFMLMFIVLWYRCWCLV